MDFLTYILFDNSCFLITNYHYILKFYLYYLTSNPLNFVKNTNLIMTWGGLRGGISIALALSLTTEMHRDMFLVITYIVVVFSIIGQGLTVGKLIKKYGK